MIDKKRAYIGMISGELPGVRGSQWVVADIPNQLFHIIDGFEMALRRCRALRADGYIIDELKNARLVVDGPGPGEADVLEHTQMGNMA